MRRAGQLFATLTVALALLSPAALAQEASPAPPPEPAEPQTSLADIEDEVMCPICGVTLELATEAPQAIQEREFIRGLVAEGLTKDEIKDRLVDEFGSEVLAVPEGSGFDLVAWLVPGFAIVAAAGAIYFGLRRWRQEGGGGPDDDGDHDDEHGSSNGALSAEETKRLNEDLARYEL